MMIAIYSIIFIYGAGVYCGTKYNDGTPSIMNGP